MGLLEDIADRLVRLEQSLSAVPTRAPAVADGVPLSPEEEVWSHGAMDLAAASEFSGISVRGMYRLMGSGRLPYTVATRERLVPRLWLIRYLAEQERAEKRRVTA